ncbi:UNVERIFIED_CONTAM: hypothetical protein ABIC26_004655 [Paenibacillus sp. PvR008]
MSAKEQFRLAQRKRFGASSEKTLQVLRESGKSAQSDSYLAGRSAAMVTEDSADLSYV